MGRGPRPVEPMAESTPNETLSGERPEGEGRDDDREERSAAADPSGPLSRATVPVALAALAVAAAVVWSIWAPWRGDGGSAPREDAGSASSAQPGPDTARTPDVFTVDSAGEFDVAGTWADKSLQTSVTDLPVVGRIEARTVTHRRVEIDQNGASLEIRSELCGTTIESATDAVETIVPEAFVETATPQRRDGRLVRSDRGALRLRIPRNCGVRGAELSDPHDGELPTSPDDRRVVDGDRDGHPGVSFRVEGAISGRLSVVQRGCDAYDGRVRSPDRIRGTVEWSTDQHVLEATSIWLRRKTSPQPHPDPDRSWFEMRRIPADTSCEEILERSDEIF